MLITLTSSFCVGSIFRIPVDFLTTNRLLFLIVGSAVALGFSLGVSGGTLEGLQRFYLLNFTGVISTLLRGLLIVIALRHGRRLPTVALITVALPLLGALVNRAVVLRILPLHFSYRYLGWHACLSGTGSPSPAWDLELPLDHHPCQLLTAEMVAQADVIDAMDFQNQAELLAQFPEARKKIFTECLW